MKLCRFKAGTDDDGVQLYEMRPRTIWRGAPARAGRGHLATFLVSIPHQMGDPLADTWDHLKGTFSRVLSGAGWARDCERFDIVGYHAAHEPTVGRNGWHPHGHGLLFLDRELTEAERVELADRMHERSVAYAEAHGLRPPARALSVVSPVRDEEQIALYLAKVNPEDYPSETAARGRAAELANGETERLGYEIARGDLKLGTTDDAGRYRGLAPMELAALACESKPHRRLWAEFERASKGRWSVYPSRNLRRLYPEALQEMSDEEAAAQQARTEQTRWLEIEPVEWQACASETGQTAYLRMAMEISTTAARAFLLSCLKRYVTRCLSASMGAAVEAERDGRRGSQTWQAARYHQARDALSDRLRLPAPSRPLAELARAERATAERAPP